MAAELLSRDAFRNGVFSRDRYRCVICKKDAKDAHHVLERRLFNDGGYYLDNGASLCAADHLRAETTELSCEEIRRAAGIRDSLYPSHFHARRYDKWGNPILNDGRRLCGELFEEPGVQRVLQPYLPQFLPHREQPRGLAPETGPTWVRRFVGSPVRMYSDAMYGRLYPLEDPPPGMAALGKRLKNLIPDKFCVEGNWVGRDFHLAFLWNDRICLSVPETKEWAALLDLSWVEPPLGVSTWSRAPEGFSYREFRDKVYEV